MGQVSLPFTSGSARSTQRWVAAPADAVWSIGYQLVCVLGQGSARAGRGMGRQGMGSKNVPQAKSHTRPDQVRFWRLSRLYPRLHARELGAFEGNRSWICSDGGAASMPGCRTLTQPGRSV